MGSRAYFFGNMYLSSIQQGIQAGHVIGQMTVKYYPEEQVLSSAAEEMFYDWAAIHKVMILLNGGYGEAIRDLALFVESEEHDYPFADFSESDAALDGALTCFGIVLPAKIYKGAEAMRKIKRLRRDDSVRLHWDNQKILTFKLDDGDPFPTDVSYTDFEVELMERLGTFRLAS